MRMLAGFLAVAALVSVVALLGNYYVGRVVEASRVYQEAVPRQAAVLEIEVNCLELSSVVIRHVSDANPNRKWSNNEEIRNAEEEVNKYLTALREGSSDLGIDKPTDPEYIAAVDNLAKRYESFKALGKGLYEGHSKEIDNKVPRNKWASSNGGIEERFMPEMTIGIGGSLDQIRTLIAADLDASYADLRSAEASSGRVLMLALIIGTALAIAIGLYISWVIMKPLKRAMLAMQHIAAGDSEQIETLTSTDEISDAMNEMNATLAAKMRDLRAEQIVSASTLGDLRRVANTVAGSANGIAATAEQLSVTTTQINAGVETQALATDETSATIEEMAASIDQVAEDAQTLGAATDETAATIGEMTTSIGMIAQTVDGLSSAVAETSSSIEEMIVSIGEVANRAREVAGVTDKAVSASENGAEAVDTMSESMDAVSGAIEHTAVVMEGLGRRSKEIGEIADVIDDIAEQTNLLALNAAIEAARAGEHGRGFAVVAAAVRDLAERSTASTKEISKLIESIRTDTTDALNAVVDGVKAANKSKQVSVQAKDALSKINDSFAEVRDAMRLIETATAEQVGGGQQILGSVEQMKRLQVSVDVAIQEQAKGSQQIVATVDRMSMLVTGVVAATTQQKRGGEQMVVAVQNIGDTTRQNVAAIQQLVAAAKDLAAQSEAMRALVRGFDADNGEGAAAAVVLREVAADSGTPTEDTDRT